ncbi:MAG: hypothetical protein LC751_19355 [Actinobacteria bacterium]|nr:hypothetical protein [Actinomycetota bacterium]
MQFYTNDPIHYLAEFRDLVARYPEALYGDSREQALLLGCSEFDIETARQWILEDGLESL